MHASRKICTPMCAKACLGMCTAKWVGWLKTKPGAGEGVSTSCAQRRVSAHEPQIWGQNSWQTWPPAGWAWGGAHKQAATKMRWFFTLQGPAGQTSAFYCKFLPPLHSIRIKLVYLNINCILSLGTTSTKKECLVSGIAQISPPPLLPQIRSTWSSFSDVKNNKFQTKVPTVTMMVKW